MKKLAVILAVLMFGVASATVLAAPPSRVDDTILPVDYRNHTLKYDAITPPRSEGIWRQQRAAWVDLEERVNQWDWGNITIDELEDFVFSDEFAAKQEGAAEVARELWETNNLSENPDLIRSVYNEFWEENFEGREQAFLMVLVDDVTPEQIQTLKNEGFRVHAAYGNMVTVSNYDAGWLRFDRDYRRLGNEGFDFSIIALYPEPKTLTNDFGLDLQGDNYIPQDESETEIHFSPMQLPGHLELR